MCRDGFAGEQVLQSRSSTVRRRQKHAYSGPKLTSGGRLLWPPVVLVSITDADSLENWRNSNRISYFDSFEASFAPRFWSDRRLCIWSGLCKAEWFLIWVLTQDCWPVHVHWDPVWATFSSSSLCLILLQSIMRSDRSRVLWEKKKFQHAKEIWWNYQNMIKFFQWCHFAAAL